MENAVCAHPPHAQHTLIQSTITDHRWERIGRGEEGSGGEVMGRGGAREREREREEDNKKKQKKGLRLASLLFYVFFLFFFSRKRKGEQVVTCVCCARKQAVKIMYGARHVPIACCICNRAATHSLIGDTPASGVCLHTTSVCAVC